MNTKPFCNTCMRFINCYEIDEYENGTIHHNGCEGSSISFQLERRQLKIECENCEREYLESESYNLRNGKQACPYCMENI